MRTRRTFTAAEVEEVRRLHATGLGWTAIGREIGRSTSGVWYLGRRLGLESNNPRGRPMDEERVERIRALRRAGLSHARVAAEVGSTRQAIHDLLRRHGI